MIVFFDPFDKNLRKEELKSTDDDATHDRFQPLMVTPYFRIRPLQQQQTQADKNNNTAVNRTMENRAIFQHKRTRADFQSEKCFSSN
jgi:hypothetical protein